MRKIIAAAFVSLDGVMQAPGGPDEDPTGGFGFGGWLQPYFDEQAGQAIDALFGRPFDLLLGRKTYDIFAAYWPHVQKDPAGPGYEAGNVAIGEAFDKAAKYVASRSRRALSWANSRWLGEDAVGAVRALKAGEGPDLVTQGSSNFLQTLHAEGLIDEVRLLTFPVVLGSGKRFFEGGARPAGMTLANAVVSPGGTVIASYQRAGEVKTGSFVVEAPTPAELERRRGLE